MYDLIVLTEARYATLDPDDWYQHQIATEEGLLIDALYALGLRVARRAWSDPSMDWHLTRAALFRSTWDYVDRIDRFRPWLAHAATRTRLINDAALIHWNLDKRYLRDLAERGIAVVPTQFLDAGAPVSLDDLLDAQGWDEVVIKPALAAGARLTWRAGRADLGAHQTQLADCLAREAMLVQPFEPAIVREGEISLIVIDGRVTHAVRKTARTGDFRVQDDHGGQVHPHLPAADEIAFAERTVRACPAAPVYARVDLVRSAQGLRLMEIELIEPELFFRFHPEAARTLASALVRTLFSVDA
ncbi:hypothetical protein G3580_01050 [Nitrogeniibacter mangrovi]|uniref:ATP-grasp fold RimK-type domain-containing protein n=1 Tax=Nitrogeniibacter mangrovi TaxID=2016596 RepID=A0A6C1B0B2_9RHOO|nr:hypothetical protein [Nitrogeniibacter mangrovi]QID16335.1 hypothetical protein G3580_01050 [Nitrogeniibacter mangrovi]